MTKEQAILKAQQVMRDYKRPDRLEAKILQQQAQQARYLPQPGGDGSAATSADASVANGNSNGNAPGSNLPKPHRARATPSTPLEGVVEMLDAPDVEKDVLFQANPFGVHAHDVLSGRGAYVNGHVGNARLRTLAVERKVRFDAGNYTDKRQLASEIVTIVKSLDPPGRFLKKASQQVLDAHAKDDTAGAETTEEATNDPSARKEEDDAPKDAETEPSSKDADASEKSSEPGKEEESKTANGQLAKAEAATTEPPMQQPAPIPALIDGIWEELSDDKAIHKACQVMRDISRPDRKYREQRKEERIKHKRNNKRRKLNDGGRVSLSTDGVDGEGDGQGDTTEANAKGVEGEVAKTEATTESAAPSEGASAMETAEDTAKVVPKEDSAAATITDSAAEAKEAALSTAVEDVVDKALLDSATTPTETLTEV
jgi:hypothetical protein